MIEFTCENLTFDIDRIVQEEDHIDLHLLADELEQFTCKDNKRDWNDSISQLSNLNDVLLNIT